MKKEFYIKGHTPSAKGFHGTSLKMAAASPSFFLSRNITISINLHHSQYFCTINYLLLTKGLAERSHNNSGASDGG
jgi:hypothetical protein